jgi:hypothetical protein
MLPTKSLRLDVYLAWINAWPFTPRLDMDGVERIMSVNEMARLFKNENLLDLLKHERLKDIIGPFCYRVDSQEILLRGRIAPSCDETNNLRHRYDPRTKCGCNALYPVPLGTTFESLL